MSSIAALRKFIKDARSQPGFTLSSEQIEDFFERMVSIADISAGYESLCWEAGVWLLLLSDEPNLCFNKYGYSAISAALSSATANNSLPDGLGWYSSGFVPGDVDGDIMLSVLNHPVVQASLEQSLSAYELILNLERLDPSDQNLGTTVVEFLSHLHRFGVDRQIQVMWAARLVNHLSLENPARELAIQLVVDGLLRTRRYVNAFYWLKAFFTNKSEDRVKDTVFEVISEVVKITREMGEVGDRVLSGFSYDHVLESLLYSSNRAQMLLSLVMLWLLCINGTPIKQDFIGRTMALFWDDYPNLTLFVKRVSSWALDISKQTSNIEKPNVALDYLHAPDQLAKALVEIKEEFERLPNYRGRAAPLDLWKECRDRVFNPLVSSLEDVTGKRELQKTKAEISNLDPDTLVRESEIYKSSQRSRRLEPNSHKMLVTDFQSYIDELAHIADLRHQTDAVTTFIRQVETEIEWTDFEQECDELIERWPSLEDWLNTYFFPIVYEWDATRGAVGR